MSRPNIVCISIDSLRADYCSFSNDAEYRTTPFLQSLSSESTVFDSAISPCTWTLPVHTSVFTGLFPPEHGITTSGRVLGQHPTFAELLSQNGYTTSAFYRNSWLDTGDILRGFEQQIRGSSESKESADPTLEERIGETLYELSPQFKRLMAKTYAIPKRVASGLEKYAEWRGTVSREAEHDRDGDRTIRQSTNALNDTESPFCWFIHLNDAHWKYDPPTPFHRSFSDRSTAGLVYNHEVWQRRIYHSRSNRFRTAAGLIDPPEREVETFKNLYRGAIEHCDTLVKRLVDGLKEAGYWENTVLIVFGDHGDAFGEDGIFGHHLTVDDSVIRVPLLIRDPTGRIDPDVVSTPTSLVDIYPTVLDLAGIDPPETNAVNLANERRDYAYTYYDVADNDAYLEADQWGINKSELPPAVQSVIWHSDQEKLIYYPTEDRYITSDGRGNSLKRQLEDHTAKLERIKSSDRELDKEVSRRLVDMGYLRD